MDDLKPHPNLTEREHQVLALLMEGRSDQEIGERLGISSLTAREHVRDIALRLGILPNSCKNVRARIITVYFLDITGKRAA